MTWLPRGGGTSLDGSGCLLAQAERVQAEQVSGTSPAWVPVAGNAMSSARSAGVILAAIDNSPMAALVTEAAARLAAADGRAVHVVHAKEEVTAGDAGVEGEDPDAARAVVRNQLDLLAAHRIPAEGQVLLHAGDHGTARRLVAEYASTIGADTIVVGAATHGGLSALMDSSVSRELWRHAARRSAPAQAKASYQHDAAGQPYRSFRGLLEHLATLTRNQVRFTGTQVTVPMLTEPTSAQREAFSLLGAAIPLTLT